MSKAYQAAAWAVNTSNDPSHGYSQSNRWGPDYDCSSFIIRAYEQADVPVREAGANRTTDMKAAFLACGFKDVTSQVNLANGYGLELGDVLLNEQNHAAMALGNGQVVHARSSEGNSIPGDQSGNEIRIQPYWNFPWDYVLRYDGQEGQVEMHGVDISNYQKGLTIQQIKDSGRAFAIIKLTEGSYLIDGSAFEFYRQAYEIGFPVGCYCYSHAVNAQQAMAEAAFLMDTIRGFPMPCGIFLDIEEPNQIQLGHDELLNIIRGWCAGIGGRGYVPGVYASAGNLWSKISVDELPAGCLAWVAKWSNTAPANACDIWQNSDTGSVLGHEGNVDTDIALSDRIKKLIQIADYNKVEEKHEDIVEEDAADACPIEKPDPAVMMIQMVMSYKGYWGEADGYKSNEFFKALRSFVDDLERDKT